MGATSTFLTEYGKLQRASGRDDSSSLTTLQEIVNDAYQELMGLANWPWLWHEAALNIQPSYSTGTVSAAAAATAFTGAGTDFTTLTRAFLEIETANERYAVPNTGGTFSATNLPIDRAVVEAVAAGSAFVLFQRRYSLAARMRSNVVFFTSKSPRTLLKITSPEQFELEAAQPVAAKSPAELLTYGGLDSSGNTTVKIWPVPLGAFSIYYEGFRDPPALTWDAETFDFPIGLLPVFRHLALSKLWAWRKDERAVLEQQLFSAALRNAMDYFIFDGGRSDAMNLDPHEFGDDRWEREVPNRFGVNRW